MIKKILIFLIFFNLFSTENDEKNIENIIIIGSGPAGLTAAIYAARAGLNPLLFEGKNPGGQLVKTTFIENWPGYERILGVDLIENMRNQALQLGTRIFSNFVIDVDFSKKPFLLKTDDGNIFKTKSVIIATGSTPKMLNIPGEGIYFGKNISTCAVCDGALYKNKKVLIIGGGDSAMEYALFLKKFTNNISIIHRGSRLSASSAMKEKVINDPDIKIFYDREVIQFVGDEKKLTRVLIKNKHRDGVLEVAEFVDGVFLAIGSKPNTEIFRGKLNLDSYGYIKTHDHVKTSIPGIFAAGEVQDFKFRQAITSAADGTKAALEAEKYLIHLNSSRNLTEKNDLAKIKNRPERKKNKQNQKKNNNVSIYDNGCYKAEKICC